MILSFGDCEIDVERRELRRAGTPVHVEPQVFDLLVYLTQNRERVVSKDDLIASVWDGRIVSDSTLTSRINAARKAIGDSGAGQKLIRTVPRKGLRFVGDVRPRTDGAGTDQAAAAPAAQPTEPSRQALPLPDRPAIAVLPFTNMSGDPEQEYFSDGISEDIITALSKLRWFFVIARNSSFVYKGKAVHMKQVAEELGVGYVRRGQRAQERRPRAHHGAAQRRRDRQPHLGRALRPRPCRRVRGAGRDHRIDRRRRSSRSSMPRKIFAPGASRRAAWMPGIW